MLLEACIIDAPFYQTSKPNINVATRVCALATKAVKFGHQRLCFLNQSTNASCICLRKNSVDLELQTVDLLKEQEIY